MRNLLMKLSSFMQGRYGTDQLNISLFVLFLVLWIANIFVWNQIASLTLTLLELLIIVIVILRSFSKNIVKRSAENRKFLPVFNAVVSKIKLLSRMFRDRKTHKYIKCPKCRVHLRVKRTKGVHTVQCPKCGMRFSKKI